MCEHSYFSFIIHMMNQPPIQLDQARQWFQTFKLNLEAEELKFLTGKSTIRGFLLHAMSPYYYRRERLWKEGELFWLYVFKTAVPQGSFLRPLPGWALFSPTMAIQNNPNAYEHWNLRLNEWLASTEAKKHQKLSETVSSMSSEPLMVPLPESLTRGELMYLTSVTFYPDHFDYPELGLKLGVVQMHVTKEIMLLPKKYIQQIQ